MDLETKKSLAPGAKCDECPLRDRGMAPSERSKLERPKAFIVSRSPGRHDVAAGRPFAGPSGKLLDYLLARNGVERQDVHTTNVVLCETDDLSSPSGKLAVRCCRPRLLKEIEDVKPAAYILAGAEALSELTDGKLTLRASRGKRIRTRAGQTLVATYNPAAALRDDVVFPDLVSDFRRAFTDARRVRHPQVTIHNTRESAIRAIDLLEEYSIDDIVAVDIESTGLSAVSQLLSIGFSPRDARSFVIGRSVLRDNRVVQRLNAYLGRSTPFLYHNGKFDVKLLRANGITNARVDEDTLLLSYVCDERPGVHSLDYLIQAELDWETYEPESVKSGKKYGFQEQPITKKLKTKEKIVYEGFSAWDELYRYNGFDTAGSRQLYSILSKRMESERTNDVYKRLLIPASNCLADVEAYGVIFDRDEARRIELHEVRPELDRLLEVCREAADDPTLNLNSPLQVSTLLYDHWGVENPLFRRGKERSVDASFRAELLRTSGASHQVLHFLRNMDRYKKLDKLRGTYLGNLADRVDPDGRLRCDFLLHGTESGRLSSRNPNLQNVPRGGKDGLPNIRSLFVAPPGRVIVQADYSQAELRTIAVTSGDERLLDIYRQGKDLHTEVATELFGSGFSKEQRVIAKNYNFGIAYGQEAFSFSQMYHISKAQARRDIDKWWSRFPGVWQWTREVHKETRKNGELYSAFGRKRRFPLITDENLDHTLKEAVNFLIQSTASDFTVYSLIRLMNEGELDLTKAFPIILVHDSIVLECAADYAEEASSIVTSVMGHTPTHTLGWDTIPFNADVQVGENWGAVA